VAAVFSFLKSFAKNEAPSVFALRRSAAAAADSHTSQPHPHNHLRCTVGHYNDEGRALFRATWSPLSAFAHPRNPKKGLKVPGDLKLAGVEEREKQFEGRAGNVLRMMDRISAHLAAVEKAEADDDEERSEYSDEP
jgi:hypothetical protein